MVATGAFETPGFTFFLSNLKLKSPSHSNRSALTDGGFLSDTGATIR